MTLKQNIEIEQLIFSIFVRTMGAHFSHADLISVQSESLVIPQLCCSKEKSTKGLVCRRCGQSRLYTSHLISCSQPVKRRNKTLLDLWSSSDKDAVVELRHLVQNRLARVYSRWSEAGWSCSREFEEVFDAFEASRKLDPAKCVKIAVCKNVSKESAVVLIDLLNIDLARRFGITATLHLL